MDDHVWLIIATVGTLLSSAWGIYALGARAIHSNGWNNGLLLLSFFSQSTFLFVRGNALGRCPLTNLFETIAFLSWSLLLTYLVIGSVYRMSILGFFTAPLVFLMNFFALITPSDQPATSLRPMGWELEMHASLSVLAYGLLGISALSGLIYLIQERQLKRRDPGTWFYRLPNIGDLDSVQRRVLWWAFGLLTAGLYFGLRLPHPTGPDWVKFFWSIGVWALYLALLLAPRWIHFSRKQIAWCSVVGYAFVLLTFWGINSLSNYHRFGS